MGPTFRSLDEFGGASLIFIMELTIKLLLAKKENMTKDILTHYFGSV
jgi:hypothetical protein